MGVENRKRKREARARRAFGYRMKVKGHISEHLIQVEISECAGTVENNFATVIMPVGTWKKDEELKHIIDSALSMRLNREPIMIVEQKVNN